jgi:Mitochondrial carrier protein
MGKNASDEGAKFTENTPTKYDASSRIRTRRSTIPIELEDPEDCTVGEAESDFFPSASDDDIHETVHQSAFKDELLKLPKEVRNILAGGIAGLVAKSVVAPIDRIKILYQVSTARFHLLGVSKVVRNIIREEGASALWKGNTATMIRVFPYSGIQFMVFDRCKQFFLREHEIFHSNNHTPASAHTKTSSPDDRHDRKWGLTPMESLVSGMIAGTVSVVCTYPLDLARAQLAVLKKKATHNQGFVSILVENYRRAGVTGLFRGISPTLLGILPYSGIAFALNEQGKREVRH